MKQKIRKQLILIKRQITKNMKPNNNKYYVKVGLGSGYNKELNMMEDY
jgi:hypothetical protein